MSPPWAVACSLMVAAIILLGGSPGSRRLVSLGQAKPVIAAPRHVRRLSSRRRHDALADAAVSVPSALALELRSGRDLAAALAAVAADDDAGSELSVRLRHAAAVARTGGDVGAVLRGGPITDPDRIGAVLQVTAACCAASLSAGLPLAGLLEAAAAAARSGATLRGVARAELAGARSTAVVLGCLPLAGIGMGQLLGARPLSVLVGTSWGAGCLVAAAVLTATGMLWSRALTSRLRRAMP